MYLPMQGTITAATYDRDYYFNLEAVMNDVPDWDDKTMQERLKTRDATDQGNETYGVNAGVQYHDSLVLSIRSIIEDSGDNYMEHDLL